MELSRRSFMALASGLFVPYEPERVYSFLPGYRLWDRSCILAASVGIVHVSGESCRSWEDEEEIECLQWLGSDHNNMPLRDARIDLFGSVNDLRESARIWGIPLRFA